MATASAGRCPPRGVGLPSWPSDRACLEIKHGVLTLRIQPLRIGHRAAGRFGGVFGRGRVGWRRTLREEDWERCGGRGRFEERGKLEGERTEEDEEEEKDEEEECADGGEGH